jgi:hypothetical protein
LRFHVNGWQRIGIVLSVCWIVGAGLWVLGQENWAASYYGLCLSAANDQQHVEKCDVEFEKAWPIARFEKQTEAAFVALAPVPLAWLLAYLSVGVARWIGRGFKAGRGPLA